MVLPDLGSGIWVGVAIGVLGISFWVVGLLVFYYFQRRFQDDSPPANQ